MVYHEIFVKREDASLHVDFKYKETVNGVDAREKARKKWKTKGYRVRSIKTRYAEPPKIIRRYINRKLEYEEVKNNGEDRTSNNKKCW